MRLTDFFPSAIRKSLRVRAKTRGRARLYREMDFLDAYSTQTDLKYGAKSPFGKNWDSLGSLQFEFLVAQGLKPNHKLFDIGCGTLRGGRFFIKYLNAANYTGVDISPKAIEACTNFINQNGLSAKAPCVVVNDEKRLLFSRFVGQKFDFILAQSVFSHLTDDLIAECFANIGKIMHDHSRFYFTFKEGPAKKQTDFNNFSFPTSFFVGLCEKHGFDWELLSKEYKHPKQEMMCIRPNATF